MRRALIVFILLLAVGGAALATLPWWLGIPLKIIGKRQGLSFERYEHLAGGRFVLHQVRLRRTGVEVQAKRVEGEGVALLPWKNRSGRLGCWLVDDWQVVASPTKSSDSAIPSSIDGWVALRGQLGAVFASLGEWIAEVRLTAGTVRWPKGRLGLASAAWKDGAWQITGIHWGAWSGDAELAWNPDGAIRMQVTGSGGERVLARSRDPHTIDAEVQYLGQAASVTARFAARGWLPEQASIEAHNWKLPAAELGLAPLYETVEGLLSLQWSQDAFSGKAQVSARPPSRDTGAPILSADLSLGGDLQTVRVERLVVLGPGLNVTLEKPVTVARNGALESPETAFRISADLGQLPWLDAKGGVEGSVQVTRNSEGKLRLKGHLGGEQMQGPTWSISRAKVTGEFAWPRLKISSGEFNLAGPGDIRFEGEYDFAARSVLTGTLQGEMAGSWLERWLPAETTCERVTFSARVEGPPGNPDHQGHITVSRPRWRGISAASLEGKWAGIGDRVQDFALHAEAKESRIEAAGEGDRHGIELRTLRLLHASREPIVLTSPATLTWDGPFQVDGLRMQGAEGSASLEAIVGERGRVEAKVSGLTPAWWSDFTPYAGPAWRIQAGTVTASWNRGPIEFAVKGSGEFALEKDRIATVAFAGHGDGSGMAVAQLDVASAGVPLATLNGTLPVTLTMFPERKFAVDLNREFKLTIGTGRETFFWRKLGDLCGLTLENPRLSADLTGTWRKPRGEALIEVERIARSPAAREEVRWPAMESVRARVIGDGRSVALDGFSATLSGQAVHARGNLPLPPSVDGWGTKDLLGWVDSHLAAEISMPEVSVATFAELTNKWIAPTGTASMNVSLKPGMNLSGELYLAGAASRPLGPLGALQDVDADIELDGRTVKVGKLRAKVGGQPVELTGSVQRGDGGWAFALGLKGRNLPLVRQTGFLVRGDVDLQAKRDAGGHAEITGRAILRDSLLLADVRSFIPAGNLRGSPLRRPPYFSVTTEPFAAWQLDVTVEGQRFLRLRTPLFSGLASARFRLGGTLAEPMATGEAVIDEGQVTLPFASFQVQQGGVSLRESDPFDPRISLQAASRRLGYDLRMEMTGTATEPTVLFSSSPPLEAEQVLRLVMAGEAPQQEVIQSGAQRALRLGTYLGQSLAGQLGVAGSRAERFSLTVGERVSREGRETYSLEVPLDDRWSVVGEYDEFDDYNVGVKWRAFRDRSRDPKATQPEPGGADREEPAP